MRILALDYGSVRVGLAISDHEGHVAFPLEFIKMAPLPDFLKRLKEVITEKEVEKIIVGIPRNMDGSYGPSAEKARAFMELVKNTVPLPMEGWDERLTTAAATRMLVDADVSRKNRKMKVDKVAAQILLQSYLDNKAFGRGDVQPF
ncbi:MAG: Holliday junction resolvase RuvX [Verrucomicrobiota bacterium]|nr:Holliday junction resolvase RuvX [Verrucomicrobiota bacterium]